MATGGKDRQSREQRERARVYQARQEMHQRQERRRGRDNVLALIVGLAVIAGAIGVQTLYFVSGPGAPLPAPSSTETPTPGATTPAPAESTPSATPTL